MAGERNYRRYYQLHTGAAVRDLPAQRLEEYFAKAAVAAMLNGKDGEEKGFDLKELRRQAEKLRKGPNFRASMKCAGERAIREALQSGDVREIVGMIEVKPKRYALDQHAAIRLSEFGDVMKTEGRSAEWKALKDAMMDGETKDSSKVFCAVEKYFSGKKSVRRTKEGRDSADLALSALAIVASSGDEVARARAQLLVDRINEVRGTQPGDKYYVRLRDYPKEELLPTKVRPIEYEDVLLDESSWEYGDPEQQAQTKQPEAGRSGLAVPGPNVIEYDDVLLDESYTGMEP